MALPTAIILSGLPLDDFEIEFTNICTSSTSLILNIDKNPSLNILPEQKLTILPPNVPPPHLILEEIPILNSASTDTDPMTTDILEESLLLTTISEEVPSPTIMPEKVSSPPSVDKEIPLSHTISVKSVSPTDSGFSESPSCSGTCSPKFNSAFIYEVKSETITNSILKSVLEKTSEVTSELPIVDISEPTLKSTSELKLNVLDLEQVLENSTEIKTDAVECFKRRLDAFFKDHFNVLPDYLSECVLQDNSLTQIFKTEDEVGKYYLEVVQILEQGFVVHDLCDHPTSHTNKCIYPKKVMYRKRDVLDLAENIKVDSDDWNFQYAVLEKGYKSFFENRSQLSRLAGAELPAHTIRKCPFNECNYNEPVYL